jgi:iron complex outermembrane receptor protein
VLGAVRADKFSVPDDMYLAYEFAATYNINSKNLFRAALTRSNSGSFFANNYLNIVVPNQPAPGLTYIRRGQQNLDLLTVNMFEIGYRGQLAENFQVDLDVFQQTADNFTALITEGLQLPNYIMQFENIPTKAIQQGMTFSVNYIPGDKFQIKPFVTIQKTEVNDMPSSYKSAAIDPTLTYIDREHRHTPSIYGGYFINYKPSAKFNVNLNGYYFTAHHQYDELEATANESNNIEATFLVNAKVNWAVTDHFNVFLNARNAFNKQQREFYGADKTGGLYLAGASFNLN